ncbi:MAG: flavodoxin family protein [Spirochaetales bacterium]|nr:flavodoxin family protein [Spirochaetales bacterium]
MKVLTLQGSPRRQGNTATLLAAFLEGLREGGVGDIQEIHLDEVTIQPCRNCDTCRQPKGPYCVIEDDMQGLFTPFIEADLVVMASPIYWWSVTAQLKLFIDRLYGLDPETRPEFFQSKKLVLILTYYSEDPNSGAEITLSMFREIAEYTGMPIAGILRYCSGTTHVRDSHRTLADARDLGRRLGGAA